MRYILIIILINACSSYSLSIEEKIQLRWAILENAVNKKWNQERISSELGEPAEKHIDKNNESWFYYAQEEGQEWSISFDLKDKTVSYIGYNPPELFAMKFTLDKILERWKKFNCENKKERFVRGHGTVHDIQYYVCDGGKRIDYNRYGEVSWIRVRGAK